MTNDEDILQIQPGMLRIWMDRRWGGKRGIISAAPKLNLPVIIALIVGKQQKNRRKHPHPSQVINWDPLFSAL